MLTQIDRRISLVILVVAGLLFTACSPLRAIVAHTASTSTHVPTVALTPTPSTPDWFNMQMTDVNTGQTFSMSDFSGKVVLVEAMATYCPSCWYQQIEMQKLQGFEGNSPDLVLVSLDVEMSEDAITLKDFATTGHFTWHFAIAPLLVARALAYTYSVNFLNPPLSPMLFIDRQGSVYTLPTGVKHAEALQNTLEPYLNP
jgi:thiol-disulfide isomerase/thioredoxin